MNIFSLFTLCGGLAFFLYGMTVMSKSLEKMAGGKLERLLKLQLADSPREEGYSLGCRLAEVQLQLQEYKAAEQTLEELVRRWPVRETPWLLRLRSAAARKSGAEVRSILQQMERTQVYLSAAGRQELAFWKGGAA